MRRETILFKCYAVDECAEMGSECGKRLKEPLRAPRERIGDCALEKDVSHVAEVMTAWWWNTFLSIKESVSRCRCQRRASLNHGCGGWGAAKIPIG